MARRKLKLIEGAPIRFVSSSLLGELGRIDEIHKDGNCFVTIMEGPHAGGSGVYHPAEFELVSIEELDRKAAKEEESD